jgi:hypothetical protein
MEESLQQMMELLLARQTEEMKASQDKVKADINVKATSV